MVVGWRGVRRFWDDHFEFLEFLLPLVLALAFGSWIYWACGWHVVAPYMEGKRGAIYGTIAALLGSLLGFVIAAAAIVLGEADRLTFIREAGQLGNLFRVFRKSIVALGCGTISAVVALIIDGEEQAYRWVPTLVLFVTVLSIERVKRTVWILGAVMKHVSASGSQ